jgi:hypothetical protein
MSNSITEIPPRGGNITVATLPDSERKGLTKKEIAADHPTWCPGCGDFSVLALYFKLIEKRKMLHEQITTVAGIGCSSRFPYFVQAHGVHFIHGRALPFASGISLSRPDLHVFVFGGDGDAFSIGGNHVNHAARKNIKMTYVIMDNFVYGLTKKDDLRHHGQFCLWPDQETNFADVADRFQKQDGRLGRGRSTDQSDETIDFRRRNVCGTRDGDQSESSFANDGSGDGSCWF